MAMYILLGPPLQNPIVLASYHGFNLDVEEPMVFQEDGASFGQSVAQFGRSRVMVGAPLEVVAVNRTGRLYDCVAATGLCQPIPLHTPPEAVNVSLGLSLTASTDRSSLLACGPTMHRACGENMYAEGFCLLLGSQLQTIGTQPQQTQEGLGCPSQEMDIVFLIDGSGSIAQHDFKRMKDFVRAVMGLFGGTNTLFSLIQYSNYLKIHFTFTQFKNSSSPQSLVDPIVQLNGLTFTATGIRRVVQELFHSKNGARKTARKILIVITDGQKYKDPLEYSDVIPQAERAGIVRYAIGVGDAFQDPTARQELNTIGSAPSQDHVFRVDNFAALSNIQKQLQEKIFAVEGTAWNRLSSFGLDLLSPGILSSQDGPVLGAVGSFGWSGGAFLYPPDKSPTFINMSQENVDMRDSYLGYSAELALWKGVQSLILGAPRHQHTGKAVIFTQTSEQWRPKAEVTGTQIGSYFGASLLTVDVDGDGSSDLVLIGAPHYYKPTQGGQVSVCPFPQGRAKWQCEVILCGEQGHLWGRFGAALTVLGDVNGDKLTDVAIGAPGEQESRGAVYLFHGTSGLGINPSYRQRIAGSQLSPTLQYFGQSLSGGQDLTQDGLVDLAVGARGQVLLTRPVLNVGVAMRFMPSEVAKAVYQCWEDVPSTQEAGSATVCITIHKSSLDKLGDVQSSVRYDLALDPGRLISRAIFDETKNCTLTRRRTLGMGDYCETFKLLLPDCVEDVVNPIILRLNFSLVGEPIPSSQNLRPVLAVGSQDLFTASLPFEKNCGQDHLCEGDLSFCPSSSSLQTLVVGISLELNVTVTLWNEGEDSYGTVIHFYYPAGLSYRRALGTQQPHQRPLRLACEGALTGNEDLKSSSCSINHPIFQEGTKGTFIVTFDVSYKATLGNKLLLRANASSENNKPTTSKTTFHLELPVKYAINMVISRQEESTKYFNFSTSEEKSKKEAEHRYRVRNPGFPLQDQLPIGGYREMHLLAWRSIYTSYNCSSIPHPKPDRLCFFLWFLPQFRCDLPSFGIQEELDFILKGNLSFGWVIMTVAEITFNRSVYSQLPGQEAFRYKESDSLSFTNQTAMVLEAYEVYDPVPLIAGSSVGGLLLLALITAVLYKVSVFIPLSTPPASNPRPSRDRVV
uniref:Integrin subunit alpha D n=1 Tax=Ursus maritimus TaxID=29073 RepID=A0A452UFI8_URSMA